MQLPEVAVLMGVGEGTAGLSGSSKLNVLVLYAKEGQEVELGLREVSPCPAPRHPPTPVSHRALGQKGSALEKRTSGACLPWGRTQLQGGEGRFWLGQVAR